MIVAGPVFEGPLGWLAIAALAIGIILPIVGLIATIIGGLGLLKARRTGEAQKSRSLTFLIVGAVLLLPILGTVVSQIPLGVRQYFAERKVLNDFPFTAFASDAFDTEVRTNIVKTRRGHYLGLYYQGFDDPIDEMKQFRLLPSMASLLNPPTNCNLTGAFDLLSRPKALSDPPPKPCQLVATTPRGRQIWMEKQMTWFVILGQTVIHLEPEGLGLRGIDDEELQRVTAFVDSLHKVPPKTLNPHYLDHTGV